MSDPPADTASTAPVAPPTTPAKFSIMQTLRRLGPAGPLALAVTLIPPIGVIVLTAVCLGTPLPAWLREQGVQGAALYAIAFWILGICFVPTNAYSILGGFCFGVALGLPAAMVGYLGAATITFAIARLLGKTRVRELLAEHPKIDMVARALLAASPGRTLLLCTLLRLSPASPFAITNVVLGSMGVSWLIYVVATVVGMLPRVTLVVVVAAGLKQLTFTGTDNPVMFAVGIGATILTVMLINFYARRALQGMLGTEPRAAT